MAENPLIAMMRERLLSDEAFRAAEAVLEGEFGPPSSEEAHADLYGAIAEAVLAALAGEDDAGQH